MMVERRDATEMIEARISGNHHLRMELLDGFVREASEGEEDLIKAVRPSSVSRPVGIDVRRIEKWPFVCEVFSIERQWPSVSCVRVWNEL
jgi:hypothetical protein